MGLITTLDALDPAIGVADDRARLSHPAILIISADSRFSSTTLCWTRSARRTGRRSRDSTRLCREDHLV